MVREVVPGEGGGLRIPDGELFVSSRAQKIRAMQKNIDWLETELDNEGGDCTRYRE